MNPKGKYKMSISGLRVCLIEGVRLIGGLLNRGFTGCLPFTRAKPVIHGLGNCTQNTGLVNFILESHLPFVQISSIYLKTTIKAWNWYQRWLWRNGTEIFAWNILSGKQDYLFRCSVAPGNFLLERPKKACPIYFPTGFCKW